MASFKGLTFSGGPFLSIFGKMNTTPYPDDSAQNLWRKIAQRLSTMLGSSNDKFVPRDGDEKNSLQRKSLNSLNSGAI